MGGRWHRLRSLALHLEDILLYLSNPRINAPSIQDLFVLKGAVVNVPMYSEVQLDMTLG